MSQPLISADSDQERVPPFSCSFWVVSVMLVSLTLAGCAVLDSRPPEAVVAERSAGRASLLMQGDFEGAYAFTTPGYRSLETVTDHKARWAGGPNWIEAEPARVTCDYGPDKTTERCKVALRILFRQFRADPLETHVFETWVKVDSGWYLYQKI